MTRAYAALATAVLVMQLAPSLATAQSTRYPPVPPDKDREDEARSRLWESALNPDLEPYVQLVRAAEQHLARNTPEGTRLALEKLEVAIARMPREHAAYLTRGRLHLARRDWVKCADDLGAAEDHSKDAMELAARTRQRIDLGVCQARAGRAADAERTLVRAAAHAPQYKGEVWMRLGEVRIELGKLDEAIDALTAALEHSDTSHQLTRWLLTAAFDRARRPTEAQEQADLARRSDPQRIYIEAPSLPLLGSGDQQYLLGVAFRYATPKPEYALVYFRDFLRKAPDSPWRRRAEEHVRELSTMRLPAKETITQTGPAAIVVEDMRTLIGKQMTTMRRCLAAAPSVVFQVTMTKVGPRTPESRDRPLYRLPTPSSRVAPVLVIGDRPTDSVMTAASQCLEAEVGKLKVPPPKEKDTWFMMSFNVVAP